MEWLGIEEQEDTVLYQAVGCGGCLQTGYRGRTGIYEIVRIDDKMRSLIHGNKGEAAYEAYARESSPGIMDDAGEKIIEGITTLEEVLRIVQF